MVSARSSQLGKSSASVRSGRPKANSASPRFYKLDGRPLTSWGDYGDILQHGLSWRGDRGLLELRRTGPFIPPITFPCYSSSDEVVLTTTTRERLEASGLNGFAFQAVKKTQIVNLPWHEWDLKARVPREYPKSGEPEDYLDMRRPNARVSQQMGDLWELVVPDTANIGVVPDVEHSSYQEQRLWRSTFQNYYFEVKSWNGADVIRAATTNGQVHFVLVAERGKLWFEENLGRYVKCYELRCI